MSKNFIFHVFIQIMTIFIDQGLLNLLLSYIMIYASMYKRIKFVRQGNEEFV